MRELALFVGLALLLVAVLPGPTSDPLQLLQADVENEEPVDPSRGWSAGHTRVSVGAADRSVTIAGPLRIHSHDGIVDAVELVAHGHGTVASLRCTAGSCTAQLRDEAVTLPAGTLVIDGAWRVGRPTGARLVAADGDGSIHLRLFGEDRARVDGAGLAAPVHLAGPLLLSGDPRDPDRVAAFGPDGSLLLDVRPGPAGVGHAIVVGQRADADVVDVTVHGDPLSHDRLSLAVRLDGTTRTLELATVPIGLDEAQAQPVASFVRLRSPLGQDRADLRLQAGPVQLAGEGVLSPQYDLLVRVAVASAEGIERVHVHVGGQHTRALLPAGVADDQTVFLGTVPTWALPSEDGRSVWVQLVFERDLAPGVQQSLEAEPFQLHLDARPPTAPLVAHQGDRVTWRPVPDAVRYEAEARHGDGPFRPLVVAGEEAATPGAPAGTWSARVRAIDGVGNAGAWSEPVSWQLAPTSNVHLAPSPTLKLTAPTTGATLRGVVELAWSPDASVSLVHAAVSHDGGVTWLKLGSTPTPPLPWDTRLYRDGPVLLRVTAEGPGGATTQLVDGLVLDNLAPPQGRPMHANADVWRMPERPTEPSTASPLPTAILAVVLVGAGSLGVLWWRHGTRGRDK